MKIFLKSCDEMFSGYEHHSSKKIRRLSTGSFVVLQASNKSRSVTPGFRSAFFVTKYIARSFFWLQSHFGFFTAQDVPYK